MATNLRPKQLVKQYRIEKLLNKGAFANAYEAWDCTNSQKVFFKQYKSPSVTLDWYSKYVDYQQELKRRIESSSAKNYAYRFIDFFESDASGQKCFYQVFEFADKGKDLDEYLTEDKHGGDTIAWGQRLIFAKLLMAGMRALHAAKIVHCDLKPKNVYLIQDTTIEAGYRLKVVDLDFSVLGDKAAPWHGKQGYTGSPGYFSPEHFSGKIPCVASDVFTCGIILYELLAQGHPYTFDDDEKYQKAVLRYSAEKPRLSGSVNATIDAAICVALYGCLNPDPAKRPTAEQVHVALLGTSTGAPPVSKPESVSVPKPSTPIPVPMSAAPAGQAQLTLNLGGGKLEFNITTQVGKALCKSLGEDAKYMSDPQFTLKRLGPGQWVVTPAAAANETLLNGKAVTGETPIKTGDVLAIGREAKGIVKLPMTVTIREG
jgi:eukaryotic-like serine/threonine-protein kinase